jgi:hypothetical protein
MPAETTAPERIYCDVTTRGRPMNAYTDPTTGAPLIEGERQVAYVRSDIHDRLVELTTGDNTSVYHEVVELRRALREIAEQDPIELVLDPTWAQRIAAAALAVGQIQDREETR